MDEGAEAEVLALTGREDDALPVAGRDEDDGLEMPLLVGAADDTERLVADALMAVEDALRVLAGALDASDVLRGASLVAEVLAGTAMTAPPRARTWRSRQQNASTVARHQKYLEAPLTSRTKWT